MKEKIAAVLFVVILAFVGVISAVVFFKLFILPDAKFTDSASAAFLGAFLAFIFVRLGDFFKSYSDRTTKNHSSLIKLEHALNALLTSLDDNIFIIERFETVYKKYTEVPSSNQVFLWANKLHPVERYDETILNLLNIDLINELFSLNIGLKKLNDSMDTLNTAYSESKDALISKRIDSENYLENMARIHEDMINLKLFLEHSIEDTIQALAAVRVLAKNRPLIGYLLRTLAGRKYDKTFDHKKLTEVAMLRTEIDRTKSESQKRIDEILGGNIRKGSL